MYKKSITHEEIQLLPLKHFEGNIYVFESQSDISEAMAFLSEQPILGFDTETRPSFKKGKLNRVALLQLSTANKAFLFRLNKMGLPIELANILSNSSIIKVGAAIRDDIKGLQKHRTFTPAGFIELQDFVKNLGFENFSLSKLSAMVLNFRISKNQRLSNWEIEQLNESQIRYAATDAWIGFSVYSQLNQQAD